MSYTNYAAEFRFTKFIELGKTMYEEIQISDFCFEDPFFKEMIDFETDFYWEVKEIDELPEGEYWCFVNGLAEFESDVDWETGIDEGHYLLGVCSIRVLEISKTPYALSIS